MKAVEELIADAHSILEQHGGPNEAAFEAIGERMRPLVKRGDLEELKAGSPLPGGRLYSEPEGLQLMLAEFPGTTAVHTHGTWGVMVGFRGTERYRQWVRDDDGSEAGKANLRLLRDIEVAPGDVGWWYPPPNDIHQQLPQNGPALELILMGHPPASERLYFDVEAGTYSEGTPAQRHYAS
jgi:hypothetical protein